MKGPAIRLLSLFLCLLPVAGADAAPPAGKPNIVFFLVDDMGRQETSKLDIEVIDLTNIFDADPRWTTDGVHPTPAGYERIANRIAATICGAKRVNGDTGR